MNDTSLNVWGVQYTIRLFFQLIFMVLSFFVAAGRFSIMRAWVYFAVVTTVYMVSTLLLIRFNSDLLNERAKGRNNTKRWDKPLLRLYVLLAFYGIHITAGLDAYRFGWSSLSIRYFIPGLILYLLSAALGGWAMVVNKHFEATVRIQDDRNHIVITEGPYRLVRHPGYLSIVLGIWAIPLMLGSLYAFLCSFFVTVIIIIRTVLEDQTLQQELEGYSDYAKKVRCKLIPFLW